MFSLEVQEQLKYYVYRLIDPRNGETFYIGKGIGNRVFAHANGKLTERDITEKLRRVREIKLAGFEVAHVIQRHGMNENTALEVEAALMDAYPATTNIARGHHSSERGVMHANEIIEKFQAEEANFQHKMVAITINRSAAEKSVYNSVRYAWKLNKARVTKAEYVLAALNGMIVGIFVPVEWLPATPKNFPGLDWSDSDQDRFGFNGKPAPKYIEDLYMRKRMPDSYRKRGAANPIRYINIK